MFDSQIVSMGADHRQKIEGKLLTGGPGNAIAKIPEHSQLLLVALEPPVHHDIPPATEEDIQASTIRLIEEIKEYAPEERAVEVQRTNERGMIPAVITLLNVNVHKHDPTLRAGYPQT